jgi:hypothetical protein
MTAEQHPILAFGSIFDGNQASLPGHASAAEV